MLLKTHRWGDERSDAVVCLHGLTQHGRVFAELADRLVAGGRFVIAVDLRGHGGSSHEPPWDADTHAADVLAAIEAAGVETATWIGHSFGGRLAADLAARVPERSERLVLLDPAIGIPPAIALRSAEIDRLDWSFATVDGALNALLSGGSIAAAPRETVAAFVRDDVRKGPDGRYRFSYCPSAAVVAWSEMASAAPALADCPTLLITPEAPRFKGGTLEARYQEQLGEKVTLVKVPNGHNVLWESPRETIAAIEAFLDQPNC